MCQDEVYLVVKLPNRGMRGCCPGHLVGVESILSGIKKIKKVIIVDTKIMDSKIMLRVILN